jgi:hypothetical protein
MKRLEATIKELANELVRRAQLSLGTRKIGKNKNYGVASGELKRSLSYRIKSKGSTRQLEFIVKGKAGKYAKFVHDGVNGTQRNVGSPYTFRKMPPRSAILDWMRKKNVKLRDKKGRFKAKTKSNMNSAAFLIARSIQRKGVKGVKFYEIAKDAVMARYRKLLTEAARIDIQERLNDRN